MTPTSISPVNPPTSMATAILSLCLLAASCAQAIPATRAQEASASSAILTAGGDDASIRPFQFRAPESALVDLKSRLAATRWPEKETVADDSQGVRLAKLEELVGYWQGEYDWRKVEAKLNALPQFVTTIDGVDIHFIHVRSKRAAALPLIITHGWPGSIIEQLKLIGPLTDPTAHGASASDDFHVVIPSLPGFGFSGKPATEGWGLERIARAWDVLMNRLGYTRYVAQGGDWGAGVVEALGRQAPAGLLGIHTNLPATLPPEVGAALGGGPVPQGLTAKERASLDALAKYLQDGGLAYLTMMGARPQAVGYGLMDSPTGLAAWMLVHGGFAQWSFGKDPKQSPTRDDVLDNITLYWLTQTAASSAKLYWENRNTNLISAAAQKTDEISVPVAITVFPDEVYRPPETWARRAFRNLIYFHEVDRGGHFAAWEHPELFAAELRAAFKSLRSEPITRVRAAAVQLSPVLYSREATVAKVVASIRELGRQGVQFATFPETVIPYYPYFAFVQAPVQNLVGTEQRRLLDQAVTVPSPATDAIGEAARQAGVVVSIGVNERDGGTLYNTQLLFDADGTLIQRRRKISPTYHERMIWGQGDGSGLRTLHSRAGRIGQLACWEHYNPLARYALIADEEQIHSAMYPGSIFGDLFSEQTEVNIRQHALESACFVVCASAWLDPGQQAQIMQDTGCSIGPISGGCFTAIVAPDGTLLGGPLGTGEGVVVADLDFALIDRRKLLMDARGHYSRPELLSLLIDRRSVAHVREREVPSQSTAGHSAHEGLTVVARP